MTCTICRGRKRYKTMDWTPDGIETYSWICPLCEPDKAQDQAGELVSVKHSDRVESNFMQSLPHPNGGER